MERCNVERHTAYYIGVEPKHRDSIYDEGVHGGAVTAHAGVFALPSIASTAYIKSHRGRVSASQGAGQDERELRRS